MSTSKRILSIIRGFFIGVLIGIPLSPLWMQISSGNSDQKFIPYVTKENLKYSREKVKPYLDQLATTFNNPKIKDLNVYLVPNGVINHGDGVIGFCRQEDFLSKTLSSQQRKEKIKSQGSLIFLSEDFWSERDEISKLWLIVHEIGHCVYDLDHNDRLVDVVVDFDKNVIYTTDKTFSAKIVKENKQALIIALASSMALNDDSTKYTDHGMETLMPVSIMNSQHYGFMLPAHIDNFLADIKNFKEIPKKGYLDYLFESISYYNPYKKENIYEIIF